VKCFFLVVEKAEIHKKAECHAQTTVGGLGVVSSFYILCKETDIFKRVKKKNTYFFIKMQI